MKCFRCGYCCVMYDVIIINPDYVSEDLKIENLPNEAFIHKPTGYQCPYLEWHNGNAFCAIHHYEWYKELPCYSHNFNTKKCMLGEYVKNNSELTKNIQEKEKYEI